MKVLVTGASGLIGSAVVRRLSKHNHEVYAPSSTRHDLCLLGVAQSLMGYQADAIVHCAAKITGIAGQIADPSAAVTSNLVMTSQLLEAAAKAKPQPHFVFLSSSTVYPALYKPMEEHEAYGPDAHYEGVGGMKLYCEQLCQFYRNKFGLRHTILRPTAVYGPGDRSNHVIPDLIRRALAGESPLKVWGSPSTVRDFVYIDDVANAICAVVEHPHPSEVFNIGSGVPSRIDNLARHVLISAGRRDNDVLFDEAKPTSIPFRAISIDKAKEWWCPTVPLAEGIARTIAWMRSLI